jgi:hypothetical protein
MKSLVISLGGTKAARVVDILAYYSQKPETRLFVEVYNTSGKRITDAVIKTIKEPVPLDIESHDDEKKPKLLTYSLNVTKEGYQPIDEKITVKPDQVSTVIVVLAKEHAQHVITAVILSLLSPFLWAILKYAGILGDSLLPILDIAFLIFAGLIAGGSTGIKLADIHILPKIKDKYVSSILGLISGEVFAILMLSIVVLNLLPLLGGFFLFLKEYVITSWDIFFIILCIVLLSFLGLIVDKGLINGLKRKEFIITLFIALWAAIGGFFGQHLLNRAGGIVNKLTDTLNGIEISNFFPLFVFIFVILWSIIIVRLLRTKNLDRTNPLLYEALYGFFGVILISFILPISTGNDEMLLLFAGGSIIGGLFGLLLYYMLIGERWEDSQVGKVKDGTNLSRKYRLATNGLVVDSVKSRLENINFIPHDNFIFLDENHKNIGDFNYSGVKDRFRKKINYIYRKNLENCSSLFSNFIIIIDLRYNSLCEIAPDILRFLNEEYSLPIFTVIITTGEKINTNWMKKVACISDTIIPVDYNLFEDARLLDHFYYFKEDTLITEDIYEEGCIAELVERLSAILEIGERKSPSGLDLSHINRILIKERNPECVCNDRVDIIPTGTQNISTFGFFSLNIKKCTNLNLEISMGAYLEYALKNTLWKMDQSRDCSYALVVVRGARDYLLTSLVKSNLKDIYEGVLVAVGDLLTESDRNLEIIILLSYIMEDIEGGSDTDEGCSEEPVEDTIPPGIFREYWDSLIGKEKPGKDESEERYRSGSYDAYTSIIKKYYHRSPLLRYRSVSIAKKFPGAKNWKQAEAIYEWVRDNISYVADPLDSEYIQLPEETLNNGGGDCDDQSVLLASMLMCIGFKCVLVFIKKHVYVAVQLPDAPKKLRTYTKGTWPDNSNAMEWVGCDPTCTNCLFGQLPDDDYQIESIEFIE